jgi:hypothetical protein
LNAPLTSVSSKKCFYHGYNVISTNWSGTLLYSFLPTIQRRNELGKFPYIHLTKYISRKITTFDASTDKKRKEPAALPPNNTTARQNI